MLHARAAAGAVILSAIFSASAAAQTADNAKIDYDTARNERRLKAALAQGPIALDARLDEESWKTAPLATNFVQNDPAEGAPATHETEVRLLYDQRALYIGVFAKDPEPGEIIVNELRKDFNTGTADGFQVVIDTFNDERNGYQFAINPGGAKWDSQMSNEGREQNANWDGIWDVATRIGDDGWYAEIEIPFKTLKFGPEAMQTWGINFQRRLRRKNENSYWSPLRRIHSLSRVSMAGSYQGLEGLRPGANVRVKPYALSNLNKLPGVSLDPDYDAGVDVKYGVTSGLTWDFTVNTDFSQVEADEQQVNLSRFSLFFPEKRDFFLENSGVFLFGSGNTGGATGGGGGRLNASQDMIFFFSRQIGLSQTGDAIPLLAGSRITGRVGGWSVGALNIQQREKEATPTAAAIPTTNFTALRLRRDILANSDIGVMFLNKDPRGADHNRAFGADANFRFFDDLTANVAIAKSDSPLADLPGKGDDWYSKSSLGWRNNKWDVRGMFQTIGARFNDEMGFVPRTGIDNAEFFVGRRFRPRALAKWVRETNPHIQFENFSRRNGGGLESRYMDWHLPVTFQNSAFVEIGTNPDVEVLAKPFAINSRRNIFVAPGRYEFKEHFVLANSNAAARFSMNLRAGTGEFYDGYRRNYTIGGTLRMNEHFNVSLSDQINDIELASGAFTTHLLTGRVNVYFTTKVFVNALVQYNTDVQQWSSNVRLDIIHRPLSDIYLVYNERHDSRSGALISRALIAKMTYLLAF